MVQSLGRQEALTLDPGYFEDEATNPRKWTWDPARHALISEVYGMCEMRYFLTPDGRKIAYGRAIYAETPTGNSPIYVVDPEGKYWLLVAKQGRPAVDHPFPEDGSANYGVPADPPYRFAQPGAMYFYEKVASAHEKWETGTEAAQREAIEELGIGTFKTILDLGYHNPSNTFCSSWTKLFEIEADWEDVQRHRETDRQELIYSSELVTPRDYLERIRAGEYDGENYRSAVPANMFAVWLAFHPEVYPQLIS